MELGVIITLIVLAFGVGGWAVRMEYRLNRIDGKLNKIDGKFMPLIKIHEPEMIKYYVEKGISPNPGMTPRKQELLDRLQAHTITIAEMEEFTAILNREKEEAERAHNSDAFVAILGLLALLAVLIILAKK